ncbi:MAG: asparagine synthase-related protein [Chloroflexota bacterium]
MSGVFGVVDTKGDSRVGKLLCQMGKVMSHHEWFVIDTYSDENIGAGIGRIGIGVFNREKQPVCSEDGNLVICLSGELYHTLELRRELETKGYSFRDDTDVELVLRLYQYKQERFICDLEGAFVLAIWDRRHQTVTIANDRFGLYPTYFAYYKRKLVFAPEMKGILCNTDFSKNIDMTALAEYVRFQTLLGDKTFFEGLHLLPNASILQYSLATDHLTIRSYWDWSHIPQLPSTPCFDEAVDEAGRLLQRAVEKLTKGPHRLGVYLSAGMDSRLILGLIPQDKFPVDTITYGHPRSRDVIYGQKLAKKTPANHHSFELSDGRWVLTYAGYHLELTEGFHSWIHAHGISVLGQIRPIIDVNLTGFGGGAIDWEHPATLHAGDDLAFLHNAFYLLSQETTWPSIDDIEEGMLFTPKIRSAMRGLAFESLCSELSKYEHLPYSQRAVCFARLNPVRRLFQYFTVFNRSHVEQRYPFYDYQYLDFVYALPPEMLFKRKLRRAVIRKFAGSLARVPYDKDDLPITGSEMSRMLAKLLQKGKSFVNGHLVGIFPEYLPLYADYESWLRTELREWGEKILLGKRTQERGIFDPGFVKSLWKRHLSGLDIWNIGKIAPLMTYEMMLRRYYD